MPDAQRHIRLVIADDHSVVRDGLERLFATVDDIDVVALATDGAEAAQMAVEQCADVVLMDLSMPGTDGISGTRKLLAARDDVEVVILTSFHERDRVLAALDAGAIGYLLKDAPPDDIIRGVRTASAGQSPLDPKVARSLIDAHASRGSASLTARERDVLLLISKGHPNKVIGQQLGISEKTVKAHVTRIFSAIGVTDRTQAALWAQRNGIE